ncbi:MAG: hypothetical protein HKN76_15255 [Saprospiraceae bacterium]|nr:hypothetical protein [Saprospiraceae bacterium]
MHIEHLAIWVKDLEEMKNFYEKYFDASAGEKYFNPRKNFSSYFLSFHSGARLEIMHKPEALTTGEIDQHLGIAHFAMSVGSRHQVDALTQSLIDAGYAMIGAPRVTGDGYYESVILDPEGNRIEITE